MPRTPDLVSLGDTGKIQLRWQQLVVAHDMARRFRTEAAAMTEDQLRDLAGSTYSDKIYQHIQVWGMPLADRDLYKGCMARGLLGADPHMIEDVMVAIKDCASLDTPVMITGETGTGKELVAR
ncbi:MAG: sigma 54-interacting transcriptional regulator, partial [Deltaproteobacteria bacterium]